MIEIKPAKTKEEIKTIAGLADIIWREHYIPIVGKSQIDYMLDKFQSAEAMADQIHSGYEYYTMIYNDKPVGYLAIVNEASALFLSKIYVLKKYRGKKIGKHAMQFIEEKAKAYDKPKIRLTVNINNVHSIEVYTKLGFRNVGPLVTDIGEGFIMDDYELIKEI
ncbi:GNAT family N-acetyltransferase [Gaetbulibacter aestuarii]|uniref:GNAT family N-acetyltransferase n=1 Tax=Gaetbulibacter aestuarii TaxID=1502358 RepID=A0ABW7MZ92_9FLAO